MLAIGIYIPLTLENKELILELVEKNYDIAFQLDRTEENIEYPEDEHTVPASQLVLAILEGFQDEDDDYDVVLPETDDDVCENLENIFSYDEVVEPAIIFYRPVFNNEVGDAKEVRDKMSYYIAEFENLGSGFVPRIILDSSVVE